MFNTIWRCSVCGVGCPCILIDPSNTVSNYVTVCHWDIEDNPEWEPITLKELHEIIEKKLK